MAFHKSLSRRRFFQSVSAGIIGPAIIKYTGSPEKASAAMRQTVPLKLGIRAASLRDPDDPSKSMVGNFDVFKEARRIPGIMGVELQVAHGDVNLRNLDTVRRYKREAHKWGMHIPTTAGVWDEGVSMKRSPAAGANLIQAIRANELLGSSVALVAFFEDDCPDMSDEASYGPVVKLLQDVAPYAADAGVTLGLENSMDTLDNIQLVDLVDHPNVKIYYDAYNMADHGHPEEAPTAALHFGKDRICCAHIKNYGGWGGDRLIEEREKVDWRDILKSYNTINYSGWFVFETGHTSAEQCRAATAKNIAFIKKYLHMPDE